MVAGYQMSDLRFINPITVFTDIGSISIDRLDKRTETYDNIITQNPIEDGSPTTDHITNLPPRINLSGGFSDIRIQNLIGTVLNPENAIKGLAKTQFDKLLELYIKKDTFQVMDGLHLFKNMQFKTLREIKDREGFSVFFEAEIWNIIKVKFDTVVRPIREGTDPEDRFKTQVHPLVQIGGINSPTSLLPLGILA